MIWHTLHWENVISRLETSVDYGLTAKEVLNRQAVNGLNEIPDNTKNNIFKKFFNQFNDYMIIILIIAAIISFGISVYEKQNNYTEPIVILFIIILNAVIGVIQEERAERALSALKNMSQPTATVLREGIKQSINAKDLVIGDIIFVKSGDFVPADARLIKSSSLTTDESSLTGESTPVNKGEYEIHNLGTHLADVSNMLWSASSVTAGNGIGVVTETGTNTQVGRIAKAIIDSKTPQTPLQVKLENTGKILSTLALIICTAVFSIGIFKNIPPLEMFMTSVSLAVAAIPEGLPAIVTIMLAIGVRKMAKKKWYCS